MHSTYIGLTVVATAWFAALIGMFVLRGRRISRKACLFLFACTTLAAATTQYFVSSWMFDTERRSAAHLVGVTRLRLEDDKAFITSVLGRALDEGGEDQTDGSADLDWEGTFRRKSRDILVTLDAVTENACIRRYYSVWAADVQFYRHQLRVFAEQVLTVNNSEVRRKNLKSYVECLSNASHFLGRLAAEMRSRRPSEYYRTD